MNLTRGAILTFESASEKEAKNLFHKLKDEQKKLMKKVKWNKPYVYYENGAIKHSNTPISATIVIIKPKN